MSVYADERILGTETRRCGCLGFLFLLYSALEDKTQELYCRERNIPQPIIKGNKGNGQGCGEVIIMCPEE